MKPIVYLFLTFLVTMLAATLLVKLGRPLDTHRVAPVAINHRIDLNAADGPTLMLLPGVGPHIAQRIVEHREQRGGFAKVEDLGEVRGIGARTLERIAPYVTCSPRGPGARSAQSAPWPAASRPEEPEDSDP